jgi:hypothetical protein
VKVAPPEAAFCGACSGGKSAPPSGAPLCSARRGTNSYFDRFRFKINQTNQTKHENLIENTKYIKSSTIRRDILF